MVAARQYFLGHVNTTSFFFVSCFFCVQRFYVSVSVNYFPFVDEVFLSLLHCASFVISGDSFSVLDTL